MNPTETKSKASNTKKNIWITASAGSGKTKVLIDRFLSLLLERNDPTKILCITFTKSAAAEIINRIYSKLGSWTIARDDDLISDIKLLSGLEPSKETLNFARTLFATLLDAQSQLKIQTIHSFCQAIISRFSKEINLDPDLKILDDIERDKLLKLTKERLLNSSNLLDNQILQNIGEFSFESMIRRIISIYDISSEIFESAQAQQEYLIALKDILNIKSNYDEMQDKADCLKHAHTLLSENMVEYNTHIDIVEQLKSAAPNFNTLKDLLITKQGMPRKTLLKQDARKQMPEVEEALREIQNIIFEHLEKSKSFSILRNTSQLLSFGSQVVECYQKIKTEHSVCDYQDLIRKCLKILQDPDFAWIKYKIDSSISHIMVDESQDTSLEQWKIIQLCASEFVYNNDPERPKTIFVVGDPKQSIYSFQGASPYLFHGINKFFDSFLSQYQIELEHLELKQSFRSDEVILSFVDDVFKKVVQKNHELFCETNIGHTSAKSFDHPSVEVWPISKSSETKTEIIVLADDIASRIEDLIAKEGYAPEDIMVLFRKRSELTESLVSSLKNKSIPVSGLDRLILNEHLAVMDLVALASFVLLPTDDYNLACIMKSPILSLSEDDLFYLCKLGHDSLWQALCVAQHSQEHLRPAFQLLNELLISTEYHTPYALFGYVLDVKMIRTEFIARFGMQVNEILDEFINVCLKYEDEYYQSLTLFLEWFTKNNIEIKREVSGVRQEVRIMTVHASKGLQAKVVILPDTVDVPQNKDSILFSSGTQTIMYSGGSENNNAAYNELKERLKTETLQEHYRLLYVALTRAMEKLIICGASDADELHEHSWYCACTAK